MMRRACSWLVPLAVLMLAASPSARAAGTSATLAVSATIVSKNTCKFATNEGALVLAFGLLDPASSADVTKTTTKTMSCNGAAASATFFLTANDGLWPAGAGARRMRHATLATEYLPYSLSISPTTATVAKGAPQTITITGTVTSADFRIGAPGGYSDTVILTVTP